MSRYRVAHDVGIVDDGDRVFVARLPDGPLLVFAGDAVDVWRAVVSGHANAVDPHADEPFLQAFLDHALVVAVEPSNDAESR